MSDTRPPAPASAGAAPTRWGILSTANITRKVLAGARASRLVDIAAVASRDRARADAYAHAHGIPRAHGTYEELLDDPEVEVVYIPLPNALHHPWTMRALAAGKHVLCEKPYSPRPAEVDEAFALARSQGLQLSEAYMYRYNPQIVELAALVRSGAIGELRVISAAFAWPCDVPDDVRLSPELGGGSLVDVGCYCVSAARLLAGEARSVTAQQRIGPSGVEVRMVGTLAFDSGVLAHFESGFHLPDRSLLEVVGGSGTIRVSDPWHCVDPGLELELQDGGRRRIPFAVTNSYTLELEAMHRAVRGETTTLLGHADALGQARTIEALTRAATEGRTVRLDEERS